MSEQRPIPHTQPPALAEHDRPETYSPRVLGRGEVAALRVGAAEVLVGVGGTAVVARFEVGEEHVEPLAFQGSDVTHWCSETSVLMEVTLDVAAGDEVSVRSPMLVGSGDRCLSLTRRIMSTGSELVVSVATSPGSMARSELLASVEATTEEVRLLLTALERAAVAATMPHGARK